MNSRLLSLCGLTLLLGSCSFFGKLTNVEYNNKIVDTVNATSSSIETSATVYNDTVPDVVTEDATIDTQSLHSAYKDATDHLSEVEGLLKLESLNIEQQNAARTDLQTYMSAGQAYLDNYQTMLGYYENGDYKTDVNKVEDFDKNLHDAYTTFIQANNGLVETLDQFVVTQ